LTYFNRGYFLPKSFQKKDETEEKTETTRQTKKSTLRKMKATKKKMKTSTRKTENQKKKRSIVEDQIIKSNILDSRELLFLRKDNVAYFVDTDGKLLDSDS